MDRSVLSLRAIAKVETMARLIGIVTIVGIALMCVLAEEELYQPSQYDDVDTKGILENEKLRTQYYQCFMGTAPCATADAKYFKDAIHEAIVTKCNRCTEKQKENLNRVADWYTTNQPAEWEALVAKSIEEMREKNSGQ